LAGTSDNQEYKSSTGNVGSDRVCELLRGFF